MRTWAFEVLPIVVLALAAVLVTLLSRCLETQDAYEAVEWKVIFMIFGMLALGAAMQETGIDSAIAQFVAGTLGDRFGPVVVLSALYLVAALLTEVISNNAVAAKVMKSVGSKLSRTRGKVAARVGASWSSVMMPMSKGSSLGGT